MILIALGGVIWSAREYIKGKYSDKERIRLGEIVHWRKLAIHKILMTSPNYLSADNVTERLRAGSFDTLYQIGKDELSTDAVRGVLMNMVSEGTIGQVFPDLFGISQLPRDISVQATAASIQSNQAAKDAFELVLRHPNRYTTNELYAELGVNSGLKESDFLLALILILENTRAAKRDVEGRWAPTNSRDD